MNEIVPASGFVIRPMCREDRPFIASSWLTSYGRSAVARSLDPKIYHAKQGRLIDRLLADASVILVAVSASESSQLRGWIVADLPAGEVVTVVHFMYVKTTFRREGVAKALLREAGVVTYSKTAVRDHNIEYTHLAPLKTAHFQDDFASMGELIAKLSPAAVFNPYRLMRIGE